MTNILERFYIFLLCSSQIDSKNLLPARNNLRSYSAKNRSTAVSTALVAGVVLVIVIAAVAGYYALTVTEQTTTSTATTTATSTATSTTFTLTVPVSLTAGGSTFVNPAMQAWITNFHTDHAQASINYQPVGSGAGQTGVLSKTFDYAGSDATLSDAQLANYTGTLLQIPESLGGVAIFYNIPEIGNTSLKLTGSVVAGIFMQNITMWNDPSITALNPGVNLPAKPIVPVHRSDGSGTTYALSDYISKVSPAWASHIGKGTSLSWPQGELAGKGSSGVAGTVTSNPESVGYADSVYAISNKLAMGQIQNSAGYYVAPTIASFQAAAASVPITNDTRISITNAPDPNAYPISTYTWVLVWATQTDYAKGYTIAAFLWYVIHRGQQASAPLNYAPLPQNVVTIDEGLIKLLSYNGTPFLT